MARSFSFGQDGLNSVNGVGINHDHGNVAVITNNDILMVQNPNYTSPEIASSPSTGNAPALG